MSLSDTIKRSLGFEESELDSHHEERNVNSISENLSQLLNNLTNPENRGTQMESSVKQEKQVSQPDKPTQHPRPTPIRDDDYVIIPERSYYEIILFRPKNIDDVNYVVDQILNEKNPVILDLSFLEKESPANYTLAGEKIKNLRERHGAQAVRLSASEDKNMILIAPDKVKVINKG